MRAAAAIRVGVRLIVAVVAGDDRDAERCGKLPGGGLVTHRPDRRRRRADPADAGVQHGLREGGVLGEEAEAGMERVSPCGACRRDHGVDVEEVECRVAVRRSA